MMPVIEVSAKTGTGMQDWLDFLEAKLETVRTKQVKV
jgi:Ni2+-binding GTPase involved in maturation of urease and hydrogenase